VSESDHLWKCATGAVILRVTTRAAIPNAAFVWKAALSAEPANPALARRMADERARGTRRGRCARRQSVASFAFDTLSLDDLAPDGFAVFLRPGDVPDTLELSAGPAGG
jgi:hypothetical protein